MRVTALRTPDFAEVREIQRSGKVCGGVTSGKVDPIIAVRNVFPDGRVSQLNLVCVVGFALREADALSSGGIAVVSE